jgi:hypothetical protein
MYIKINKKLHKLDVDAAQKCGALTSAIVDPNEMRAGDVFIDSKGNINPFLLVEAATRFQGNEEYKKRFQLVGMGVNINSGLFFESLHTLEEVADYLNSQKMVFARNINLDIVSLVNKEALAFV